MLDTVREQLRTDYTDTSLPLAQRERLAQLVKNLSSNQTAYESHVEVIQILHDGFLQHVRSSGDPSRRRDPSTYDLLPELRAARQSMHRLFAIGENLWHDWLQDESHLARTTEERIAVIEQCRSAITEEHASVKLWLLYGEWVRACYDRVNLARETDELDEDMLVGREVFKWDMVLETWTEAAESTRYDLGQSHLAWNKLKDVRLQELDQNPLPSLVTACQELFKARLHIPHVNIQETLDDYSTFITKFMPDTYEQEMQSLTKSVARTKAQVEQRSEFEFALVKARDQSLPDHEYHIFEQYLAWECGLRHPKFDLCNALYERTELRFPSAADVWRAHVALLIRQTRNPLPVLSRATRHCPWSGDLWAQYILSSEIEACKFQEVEAVKHKATSTGVLETAGVEETLKVHTAWCSYLRRRACQPPHLRDEDDIDIAEMGIRASMESVSSLGAKLGLGDTSDSTFRLQQIYINFLSDLGRWDNARLEFDRAIQSYGTSYSFWQDFYNWEMIRWHKFANQQSGASTSASVPHLATAVLKKALDEEKLDYPEPIVQLFKRHCQDHEDTAELQACILKAHDIEARTLQRRQEEARQQAELVQQDLASTAVYPDDATSTKRRRDDHEPDSDIATEPKRAKLDDTVVSSVEQVPPDKPKRDRENASILVSNLPESMTQAQVRRFFSQCGIVKTVKMVDNSSSAIVEFEDDVAARYALSRDGQEADGSILQVALDTGSTVFVTNYDAAADESYIRDKLRSAGEIVNVRFPSLQGNKRRRFCYVQFKSPQEAQTAVQLFDGTSIDGLTLTCKLSNPTSRKSRQDYSVNDGRTVFVGGLNFKLKEDEVTAAFSSHGTIERIRLPLHKDMKNRNTGIAFLTFSLVAEAQSALAMNGATVRDRAIKVQIATDDQDRSIRRASTVTDALRTAAPVDGPRSRTPEVSKSRRTVYIVGVPDTVNEARLRRLAERHGRVTKCVLKTTHQGAVLEYASEAESGEAALALEKLEIDPGRFLRVVDEPEMKAQPPERKVDGVVPRARTTTMNNLAATVVKRPSQPTARTRKGGHLGRRTAVVRSDEATPPVDGDGPTKRSNDDFRALLKNG